MTLTGPGGPSLSLRSGRAGAARSTSVPGRVSPLPPGSDGVLSGVTFEETLSPLFFPLIPTHGYSHAFLPSPDDNTDILLLRPPGYESDAHIS